MAELFSYCVRHDGGSAPNPFWDVCTLVICKPQIRRAAQPGDWVVGTGSSKTPVGNLSGAVVYAMRVGRKLTMAEYDKWATAECPRKVPDLRHTDYRRAVGDAVYDFATNPPQVRPGPHTEAHQEHDLSGGYALLADRFIYFGRGAEPLPAELQGLVKSGPGHKRVRDVRLVRQFVEWLASLGHMWGTVLALPAVWPADAAGVSPAIQCRAPKQAQQMSRVKLPSRHPC